MNIRIGRLVCSGYCLAILFCLFSAGAFTGCASTPPRTTVMSEYRARQAIRQPQALSPSQLARQKLSDRPVRLAKNTWGRRINGRNAMAVQQTVYAPVLTYEQMLAAEKCGILTDDSQILMVDGRAIISGTAKQVAATLQGSADVPWYYTVWGQGDPLDDRIPPPPDPNASCPLMAPPPDPSPAIEPVLSQPTPDTTAVPMATMTIWAGYPVMKSAHYQLTIIEPHPAFLPTTHTFPESLLTRSSKPSGHRINQYYIRRRYLPPDIDEPEIPDE